MGNGNDANVDWNSAQLKQVSGFDTKSSSPVVVHVETQDGNRYELKLVLALVDVVEDTSTRNAEDPTLPAFTFKAQILTSTRRLP